MQYPCLEVTFSPAEVTSRLIVEGGQPLLLKRHHAPVEGKVPYTFLLCDKLREVVQVPSRFSVHEGFRDLSDGISRCWVLCGHKEKMSVTFTKAHLIENQELKFSFEVKCGKCMGTPAPVPVVAQSAPQVPPTAPAPVVALPFPLLALNLDDPIVAVYRTLVAQMNASIVNSFSTCFASNAPLETFLDNKQHLGQSFQAALDASADGIRLIMPLSEVSPPRPTEATPSRSLEASNNAYVRMSQAQKRVHEQANLAPKRLRSRN